MTQFRSIAASCFDSLCSMRRERLTQMIAACNIQLPLSFILSGQTPFGVSEKENRVKFRITPGIFGKISKN